MTNHPNSNPRGSPSSDTEILFNARRPLILNGISDIATRHDLADRALIVHLPPILEKKRMAEKQLEAAWTKAKPAILKTLLDAVVSALQHQGCGPAGAAPDG